VLLDIRDVTLSLFLGVAAVLIIWLAFRYPRERASTRRTRHVEEYQEGLASSDGPIPPLLVFLYVVFLVWAVGYLLAIGIWGGPF
jgi:hypothetical protein